MLKFFSMSRSDKALPQSAKDSRDQENAAINRLLQDFPWLWAVRSSYSSFDSKNIKVSQDMRDLKTALEQSSDKTKFSLWKITSEPSEYFNMQANEVARSEGKRWSEVVMQQTSSCLGILYLVTVDPEECHPRRITIFRSPDKGWLNDLVGQVCQLLGSDARWIISSYF